MESIAPVSTVGRDPLLGTLLADRYLIREPIAEGGMAMVYRATQDADPREVAVKVMHAHLTRDRGYAQRFKREVRVASKLVHPSIVGVLDHGVAGHFCYLVMEVLDGEDLFDVLRRERRLDEAVARRVVIEICEALAEAHGQGVIHRDLKPENVFLARASAGELRVKVLDFGIAKTMYGDERGAHDSDQVLTAMGAILGTPEYVSPEMCRGEQLGPGADVYACGVLLYALLTGSPPFVTARPLDVTMKHVSEAPRPPSEVLPGLAPALEAIILKALAKRPEQRQPSAAALAEALREGGRGRVGEGEV